MRIIPIIATAEENHPLNFHISDGKETLILLLQSLLIKLKYAYFQVQFSLFRYLGVQSSYLISIA